MSYPTGVLECLVRIETQGSMGTGVLFGRDSVLTCAHNLNANLRERLRYEPDLVQVQGTSVALGMDEGAPAGSVALFDGTRTTARLHAVHANEDLVLLKLDQTMDCAVYPPPFGEWAAPGAVASSASSAFGFRARGSGSPEIQGNAVEPVVQTDLELGSGSPMFFGNAPPGMSGGPVIGRIGNAFHLVGLTVLGGVGSAHGRLIQAGILRAFLARHTDQDTVRAYEAAGQQFGCEPIFESRGAKFDAAWQWIRQARASELRAHPDLAINYIASRPLLMSDIDALWKRERSPAVTGARSRCFAELTATEAKKTIEKLRSMTALSIRAPRAEKPFGRLAIHKRRALPIEFDSSMVDTEGFAVLPVDVAEWRSSDGDDRPRRVIPGDRDALDADRMHFTMGDTRALLRPQLCVPVWSDA